MSILRVEARKPRRRDNARRRLPLMSIFATLSPREAANVVAVVAVEEIVVAAGEDVANSVDAVMASVVDEADEREVPSTSPMKTLSLVSAGHSTRGLRVSYAGLVWYTSIHFQQEGRFSPSWGYAMD